MVRGKIARKFNTLSSSNPGIVENSEEEQPEYGNSVREAYPVSLTEEQRKLLEDIKESPLPSQEIVRERQLSELRNYEDIRDKQMEDALKRFASQITDEFDVNCPEIIAIPKLAIVEITDGRTNVASYWNNKETVYVNQEDSTLDDFCHELKHHIDYKQRGRDQMVESLKCRFERTPYWDCPTEERARKFAIRCVVSEKIRNDWKKKVEPIIGPDRIMKPLI